MVNIAKKNIFHDKKRFIITSLGLIAAFYLMLYGSGTLSGTFQETGVLIENTDTDIWVVQEGNIDTFSPSIINQSSIDQIEKIEGIKLIEKILHTVVDVEIDGKESKEIFVVGFNLESNFNYPWDIVDGNIQDLNNENSIIVDNCIEAKFGKIKIGDKVNLKISQTVSFNIVGKSQNAKFFTHPYFFTSYENAQKISPLGENQTNFVVIKLDSQNSIEETIAEISAIDGVDAFTKKEILENTVNFYTLGTPIGIGFGISTLVGLFVGFMVITLTIYSATVESIPEYGTLKAIGASKRTIKGIIFEQVFLIITISYIVGAIFSYFLIKTQAYFTLMPFRLTFSLLISIYFIAMVVGLLGALNAVKKVNKVDPAIVFRA